MPQPRSLPPSAAASRQCGHPGHMARDCPDGGAGGGYGGGGYGGGRSYGGGGYGGGGGGGGGNCYRVSAAAGAPIPMPAGSQVGALATASRLLANRQDALLVPPCLVIPPYVCGLLPAPLERAQCGQPGHMARDCPEGGGYSSGPPGACYSVRCLGCLRRGTPGRQLHLSGPGGDSVGGAPARCITATASRWSVQCIRPLSARLTLHARSAPCLAYSAASPATAPHSAPMAPARGKRPPGRKRAAPRAPRRRGRGARPAASLACPPGGCKGLFRGARACARSRGLLGPSLAGRGRARAAAAKGAL
jgi:hypothetical protein